MIQSLFSNGSDNWSTPRDFYQKLNDEFFFNLDPCADEFNHCCSNYFTENDDGLSKSWSGFRVFCNPPYSKIKDWVKKAYQENLLNNTFIVLLIPARTDTKWFHDYIYNKHEIRFVKGRLRFNNSSQNAPFPSMVVVMR